MVLFVQMKAALCVWEYVFKRGSQRHREGVRPHISVESLTYRPNTVENNHSLFAHGCQGVGFAYICHNDVHLRPQLRLTCMHKNTSVLQYPCQLHICHMWNIKKTLLNEQLNKLSNGSNCTFFYFFFKVWRLQMCQFVETAHVTSVQFSAWEQTAETAVIHGASTMFYVPSAVSRRIKPKRVERQLNVILWKLASPITNRSNWSIVRDSVLHDWGAAQMHVHAYWDTHLRVIFRQW